MGRRKFGRVNHKKSRGIRSIELPEEHGVRQARSVEQQAEAGADKELRERELDSDPKV